MKPHHYSAIFHKFIFIFFLHSTLALCAQTAQEPQRLQRKDSFFGVHFDWHAWKTDKNIGENTTPEMINAIIDMLEPDFIQVDTKGHKGVSSYPTKIGFHNDSIVGDPLRVWRDVTARRGVALYAHHSGLYDEAALETHPEWAVIDAKGNRSGTDASIFSPFVDNLLIPQLLEIATDYNLDGVWLDGHVWRVRHDYGEASKKAFSQKTGITNIPLSPADVGWAEWTGFHRDAYRDSMRHTIREIRKKAPGFQICDNNAFAEHMPEPVCFDVDYISIDLTGRDAVNCIRIASRLVASQGIPWDLMSWSFYTWNITTADPPEARKPAVQLKREAACVISQGGAYQAVFSQIGPNLRRDGSIDLEKLKPFAEVARFCRERQEISFKARAIPQVAVLISTEAQYKRLDSRGSIFRRDWWQRGILNALLENQYGAEILPGGVLVKRIEQYPLVVIYEWEYLEPELHAAVVSYVKNGGKLLLVGQAPIRLFEKELNAAASKSMVDVPLPYSMIRFDIGKGSIGIIPHTLTVGAASYMTPEKTKLIGAAVHNLFPDPIVTVAGSHDIDISLMRTVAGKTAVHLVNTSGPHRTAGKIETIDPVGPLQVTIRCDQKPARITLHPAGKSLPFTHIAGKAQVKIDSVDIHEILLIE